VSKIWFCRTCGYEVESRGRCHACKGRLERSPLPELAPAGEDDEVGYRMEGWTPAGRGRLIVALIEAGIEHRFDEDDLVVGIDDEERTDEVVAAVVADLDDPDPSGVNAEVGGAGVAEAAGEDVAGLLAGLSSLLGASRRLQVDPTDMHADADVAEASAAVFATDGFFGADEETWAAVGRVTRRLLAALGADEALEEEIRRQAAVLSALLAPLLDEVGAVVSGAVVSGVAVDEADADEADAYPDGADRPDDEVVVAGEEDGEGTEEDDAGTEGQDLSGVVGAGRLGGEAGEESVYELPEWLPEQRAELGLLLGEAGVGFSWEGADLVVPAAAEATVEELFARIEGVRGEEDDGERYQALAELFAAADRFVNDPDSKAKAREVVRAVAGADGPTPLGLDDAQWWTIRTRARILADAIEHEASLEVVFAEATTLRDLLRQLV